MAEPDRDAWNPELLEQFRARWNLNHMEVMRILQRGGMEKLNYSTFQRWRKSREAGGSEPRPLYRDKIEEILRKAERTFERDGRVPVAVAS